MATGGPLLAPAAKGKEAEDFRHSCGLCMEPYNRRRVPKMLPCFHSFCYPCLTALEASVGSAAKRVPPTDGDPVQEEQPTHAQTGGGEESEARPREKPQGTGDDVKGSGDVTASQDDVGKASFPCPACRAPVAVPEGGVGDLQTNFYVDHDLGPDEDPPSVLCDMCEEDNQQHATHTCQECRTSMCRTCQRHHDKYTRDHHMTPVGLGQPAKGKGEKEGRCLVHRDQVLCFHCRQCDIAICLHCKVTSHEGHDTVDLTSAALQAQEEIASLIPTAQQQLRVMETAKQQVDREHRALTRHAQEVTQQIHARRDMLVTRVTWSHDRLVDEVSTKEALSRSQLDGEKACIALTQDTLTSLLSRAARATAGDPQVLTCRKELKAALLSQDQVLQHQQRADSQGHSWDWKHGVTEAPLMLQEDDISAFMGRVVEGEGSDAEVSRVPVSWRELESRVERLTKEVTANTNILASQISSCTDDLTRCQNDFAGLQKKGDELEKKTASLQDEMATSRKTEADLQKTSQSLMKKFGQARELFHAMSLNKDTTQQGGAITFKKVLTNKEYLYAGNKGIFTAPQNGLYFINAALVGGTDITVCGRIKVNNETHCVIQGGDYGGSGSVLVPLSTGQKVWLEAVSPVDQYDNSNYSSYFRGMMVLPMP